MGKSKSPSIPNPPEFRTDPNLAWSQEQLKGQVPNLLSLSNLPQPLMEAISTNPDVTRLTLEGLQANLAPSYRRGFQDITNTLEANNQLTGSTTASALGNYESDYMAQLTAAGAQAGLADIDRALSNRVQLYGMGLNSASAIGNTALNNQSQMNQFALSNYENQVSQALLNQPQQRGGLMGGLIGAVGGGISGFALGGPVGAAVGAGVGGLAGGLGAPGTGGSFLNAGASTYGASRMATLPSVVQGSGETIYNPLYNPYGSGGRGLLGPISNYYPYGLN